MTRRTCCAGATTGEPVGDALVGWLVTTGAAVAATGASVGKSVVTGALVGSSVVSTISIGASVGPAVVTAGVGSSVSASRLPSGMGGNVENMTVGPDVVGAPVFNNNVGALVGTAGASVGPLVGA